MLELLRTSDGALPTTAGAEACSLGVSSCGVEGSLHLTGWENCPLAEDSTGFAILDVLNTEPPILADAGMIKLHSLSFSRSSRSFSASA